jgi:hypothetical protein
MSNTLTQWRPLVYINGKRRGFPTYAEIKKQIRNLLRESETSEIMVLRSRRGDWGEWFEYWGFNNNGKPVITKKGWM